MFVKKRNKSEPMELVPWKSINPEQKNNDILVPQRATTITTLFLLLFLCSFPIIITSSELWLSLTFIVGIIHIPPLPLILIFTIKQKTSAKNNVCSQPPRNLQFHENISRGMN